MRPGVWPCGDLTAHLKHVHAQGPDNYQYLCPGNQTDDGAAAPGPELGGAPPARPEASEVVSGTVPSSPRRFQLWRHRDPSGVSGTGLIAEGTQWRDGTASLRWYGDHPSTVAWPSVADIVAVHGHQGATELVWLDDEPIDLWPTEGGPA